MTSNFDIEPLDANATIEEHRNYYEKLINLNGSDIPTAALNVWRPYIEFEVDEYEDKKEEYEELLDEKHKNMIENSESFENHKHELWNEIKQLKLRIIKLYHRQLSLPLLGNCEVLVQFENWLGLNCDENDLDIINPKALETKYNASVEQLNARMPFETFLLSDDYQQSSIEDKLMFWRGYIRFEINDMQMHRAKRLFERALYVNSSSVNPNSLANKNENPINESSKSSMSISTTIALWKEFIEFAQNQVKDWHLVYNITTKCKNMHPHLNLLYQDMQLYKLHFYALEFTQQSEEQYALDMTECLSGTYTQTTSDTNADGATTNNTDSCIMFSTPQEYISFYQLACDYYKRQISKLLVDYRRNNLMNGSEGVSDGVINDVFTLQLLIRYMKKFRQHYDTVIIRFMDTYYTPGVSDWIEGWISVIKYRMLAEDTFFQDIITIHILDEDNAILLSNANIESIAVYDSCSLFNKLLKGYPKSYIIYSEYIHWAMYIANHTGTVRKLFKRAIHAVNESAYCEELARQWVVYEREICTEPELDVLMEAEAKYKLISEQNWKKYQQQEKALWAMELQQNSSKSNVTQKHKQKPKSNLTITQVREIPKEKGSEKRVHSDVSGNEGQQSQSEIEIECQSPQVKKLKLNSDEDCKSEPIVIMQHPSETVAITRPKDAEQEKSKSLGLHRELDGNHSVLVKNLHFTTTAQELHQHMSISCPALALSEDQFSLQLARSGRSLGSVLIQYLPDHAAVESLIANFDGKVFNNRKLLVSVCEAAQSVGAGTDQQKNADKFHPTTVYVSKLDPETTDKDLSDAFSVFGTVVSARVNIDKRSHKCKVSENSIAVCALL